MKQQTSATTETFNKGRAMIDFTGKTIFVGIDVHKEDWQVGQFYNGLVLGNHRITGSSGELINFLKKRYAGATLRCVYESCAWGFNLQRQLAGEGIECIVVHAGDVPGSDKEKKTKPIKLMQFGWHDIMQPGCLHQFMCLMKHYRKSATWYVLEKNS